MLQVIEFLLLGQTSHTDIVKIKAEIEDLKKLQDSIKSDLAELALVEEKERKGNFWEWIIDGAILVALSAGVVYLFYSQTDCIKQFLDTISLENGKHDNTIIDRLSQSD